MKTLRILSMLVLFISITDAFALVYIGNVSVFRVRIHDNSIVYFNVTGVPSNTCNNWGEELMFDYTTPQGKAMYSTLLAAKAASKSIAVWYEASLAPGTDHTSGCDTSTMAKVTGIAIN